MAKQYDFSKLETYGSSNGNQSVDMKKISRRVKVQSIKDRISSGYNRIKGGSATKKVKASLSKPGQLKGKVSRGVSNALLSALGQGKKKIVVKKVERIVIPQQYNSYASNNKFTRNLARKQASTDKSEAMRARSVVPHNYVQELDRIRQLEIDRQKEDAAKHDLMKASFNNGVKVELMKAKMGEARLPIIADETDLQPQTPDTSEDARKLNRIKFSMWSQGW